MMDKSQEMKNVMMETLRKMMDAHRNVVLSMVGVVSKWMVFQTALRSAAIESSL